MYFYLQLLAQMIKWIWIKELIMQFRVLQPPQFKQGYIDLFEVTFIVIDQLMKYECLIQPVATGR